MQDSGVQLPQAQFSLLPFVLDTRALRQDRSERSQDLGPERSHYGTAALRPADCLTVRERSRADHGLRHNSDPLPTLFQIPSQRLACLLARVALYQLRSDLWQLAWQNGACIVLKKKSAPAPL